MLVVTHEMQFAREVADRVIFMADGEFVEQGGPPEQIFTNPQDPRLQKFLNKVGDPRRILALRAIRSIIQRPLFTAGIIIDYLKVSDYNSASLFRGTDCSQSENQKQT